jgi:asparagine synthase (glutamine-hydrolysing)
MSGIVGILHLDDAPVDRTLLQRLTDFQSFRGPDAKQMWLGGNVGFGHTLLKTTDESEHERQPFTLGDEVWIVADARIDARRDLIAELEARGQTVAPGVPDVELILRAYQAWGEDCVEHLLGDFSFGIWDGPRKHLFCARDQMGVKSFYYAHLSSCVIFSNSLECIRQHPAVSDRLNDLAIADFLLFERNLEQETTSFADIQRLAPAHKAVWSNDTTRKSRYWTAPIEEPIFYKRSGDYTDRFMELMRAAVGDRLRTQSAGILMSGGVDSPAIAAIARDLSQKHSPHVELRAFTNISSASPEEGSYAEMVARQLQIPIEYHDWEAEWGVPDWEQVPFRSAQPVSNINSLTTRQRYWRDVASRSRVFLQGEGPDNALFIEWKPYVAYLMRTRRFARLFVDSCQYLAWHRRIPFWGRISRSFQKRESESSTGPSFPDWINKDLESRLELHARWNNYYRPPQTVHPVRPLNYALLHIPGEFQDLFRSVDAESTRTPVEVRFPFMDLRVLRYFLTVPSIPWCRNKYLLRQAMKGWLPDAVLRRPKTGVPHTLTKDQVRHTMMTPLKPAPEFSRYVDTVKLPTAINDNIWAVGSILLARLLNHWLQNSYHYGHINGIEVTKNEFIPEDARRRDG